MAHDAFAHRALGSSALMIIAALHARPAQTAGELVITSSVSRATVYRALDRLTSHGLVHHIGETWILAPAPSKASVTASRRLLPPRTSCSHVAGTRSPLITQPRASQHAGGHYTRPSGRRTG